MAYDTKPDGFIYKSIPKSPVEAVAKSAEARVTYTVKSGIQWYLEQYLNTKGMYRAQLKETADFSIQYETNISVPNHEYVDPSIYEVQLARFHSQLRFKLPCIIISDTGFNYTNPGLGGNISSSRVNGETTSSVVMKMDCSIPLKLTIAAKDETSCGDLRDILVYIFGPLTTFNKSHVIRSTRPEDSWETRLPTKIDSDMLDKRPITDDKQDVFWITSISLLPEFEGTVDFSFDKQVQEGAYAIHDYLEGTIPRGIIDSNGNVSVDPGWLVSTITVPTTISLNHPVSISAKYRDADSHFVTDNPNIALIDGYRIIPRKLGTFNVMLIKNRDGSLVQKWVVRVVA